MVVLKRVLSPGGQGQALLALLTLLLPQWWPGLGFCMGDGGGREAPVQHREPPAVRMVQGGLGTCWARRRPCFVFACFAP